jgi:nucleoside-triphosphatase
VTRLLLEGRPGAGKTTLARAVVRALLDHGLTVSGITTDELRERGRRVGFAVEAIGGETARLAHVDLPGPPRVGKYGVDLAALERVGLPALQKNADVVVIDEIGKMELASSAFRAAVEDVLNRQSHLVATVHAFSHPLTDALKARSDTKTLLVTASTRDELLDEVLTRLRVRP